MRRKLDGQLETIHIELIKMGASCERIIELAFDALNGCNSVIEQIAGMECEIDEQEREIESLCLKVLLQQQPVASDLRLVSAALKMISDMERIGDQALDIAEISRKMQVIEQMELKNIKVMAKVAMRMVSDSVLAFIQKDLVLAQKVIDEDDQVDEVFEKVKNQLILAIKSEQKGGEHCLDLLMIAKYFERIGDHATNIAERVVFAVSGIQK